MNETGTQEAPLNIAAMMAKEGSKTDNSPVVYTGTDNTPDQPASAEPLKAPEGPAAETTVTPPAAPATPAPEPPRTEVPRTETVAAPPERATEQPSTANVDWRELLKKQPESDVLKAVGLDEKMINFLTRWKGGEDLKDYYEAISVDYSKMSPEELLRRQLHKEFGSLSAEDFEEVYKMKVIEQYKLDSDLYDEKEVRRGRLMLGIDAERVRQDFMKKQQDLLLSKPPAPEPSTAELEAKAQAEQQEKDRQAYKAQVDSNEYTKQLLSTKLLKIGDGDKAFNLEIANPNDVLDLLYDGAKWAQKLWNPDGTPNIRKQLILGAIANDDTLFFTNLANHYQALGTKALAEELQNASEPTVGNPAKGSAEQSDPISQLARFGTITSG
jgi:hypothetical protein